MNNDFIFNCTCCGKKLKLVSSTKDSNSYPRNFYECCEYIDCGSKSYIETLNNKIIEYSLLFTLNFNNYQVSSWCIKHNKYMTSFSIVRFFPLSTEYTTLLMLEHYFPITSNEDANKLFSKLLKISNII